MPRQLTCIIHRLRLGHPSWEDIRGNVSTCGLCGDDTDEPLQHYLLQCPTTDRLRQLVGHQGQQATGDPRSDAALLTRRLLDDSGVLKELAAYPPPR